MPRKKFEDMPYNPFASVGSIAPKPKEEVAEPEAATEGAKGKEATPSPASSEGGEAVPGEAPREQVVTLVPKQRELPSEEPVSATSKAAEAASDVATATAPSVATPPPVPAKEPPKLARIGEQAPQQESSKLPKQVVQKRFRVTEEEEGEFESFVLRLRQESGTKVDFSIICRTLWTVLQGAEGTVVEEVRRAKASLPRHPGKHDSVGLAQFEEHWARILTRAFRRMPPPPSGPVGS